MPTEVIFPKVDMDMATGQISRWFYKEGDAIKKGEPLFEIETDKAAMEIDAPASGTLAHVTGAQGVDIAVGSPVAWIFAEGEAVTEAGAPAGSAPVNVGPDPDVEVDARLPQTVDAAAPAGGSAPPKARPSCQPCAEPGTARNGVRATPLARRLARERGIDLSGLTGRGPQGRIQREDVEAATGAAPALRPIVGGEAAAPVRVPAPVAARSQTAPAERAPSNAAAPLHVLRLREGQGMPIVLIHGFGSESASWRPLLAELAEGDAPVLGIDLPGHGGSLGAPAESFEALVSAVEDTLAAEDVAACHLVGHSLGGAVAAAVAAGLGTDVRSLMLLSPAGFGPDIDTGFIEGFAQATEEAPVRAWLRHLVTDPAAISDGFVRATARGRADGRQTQAQLRMAGRLFSNGTQHVEVRSLLPHLAMPVKIVAGADDRVVPVRHFTGLPGTIALHVFAQTGHLPQMERRGDVARLLRQLAR